MIENMKKLSFILAYIASLEMKRVNIRNHLWFLTDETKFLKEKKQRSCQVDNECLLLIIIQNRLTLSFIQMLEYIEMRQNFI